MLKYFRVNVVGVSWGQDHVPGAGAGVQVIYCDHDQPWSHLILVTDHSTLGPMVLWSRDVMLVMLQSDSVCSLRSAHSNDWLCQVWQNEQIVTWSQLIHHHHLPPSTINLDYSLGETFCIFWKYWIYLTLQYFVCAFCIELSRYCFYIKFWFLDHLFDYLLSVSGPLLLSYFDGVKCLFWDQFET